jgi:hypothetical protein
MQATFGVARSLILGASILAPSALGLEASATQQGDQAGGFAVATAPAPEADASRRVAFGPAPLTPAPNFAPDSVLPEMRRPEERGLHSEAARKSLAGQPGCTICLGGTGTVSWSGTSGSFHVDTISNNRSSGTSGTLDLRIAFSSSYPVFGQSISYYSFSDWITMNPLTAGMQYSNVNSGTVGVYPASIPAGQYWVLLYLREYQGGSSYAYTDFLVMNSKASCNGVSCTTVATCAEDTYTMCLASGRYRITSRWRNQYAGGAQANLYKSKLTDYTGAFWISDASTYEYMIRMSTATDNGRAWIAIPTFTDVEFWITVTDTIGGQSREYHSLPGNRTLIFDPTYFVFP